MDFEGERTKGVHKTHPNPTKSSQDAEDLNPRSLISNDYNLWETITSRGASFLVSEIAHLAIGILYDDPLSYGLYKIAQTVLDTHLQSKTGLLRFARNDNNGRHCEERKRRSNPVFLGLSGSRRPLRGLAMTTMGKIVFNRQN